MSVPAEALQTGPTIRDLMTDSDLFGGQFSGESWAAWRALLAGFYGLELDEAELETLTALTGLSEAPETAHDELWLAMGRRGGKSNIAALIAIFESCFRDYSDRLAPGERATVLCICPDRKQARTNMRYISGLLHSNPMLERMIEREERESIELANRTSIEIGTASFRAVRGYTLAAVICDEIAFWRSDESANPDIEILNALRPAMATLDGRLIALSSPYARRGALWDTYRAHYGQSGPVLVAQAETRLMNPSLPERVIAQAYTREPVAASAEYGAQFRRDLEEFVSLETVMACIEPGCKERPPVPSLRYHGFIDPSGGSADSMTMAVAHKDRSGKAILDCVREVRPPFSPEQVCIDFAKELKNYGIRSVNGDRYGAQWVVEQFGKCGITYRPAEKSKSDIYKDVLPLLNSEQCELLDDQRLINQLQGLERRTSRGGRDSIDHAPGAHDDVVNAAAGALTHATTFNRQVCFTNLPRML